MLPNLSLLAQIQQQILKISNRQGEYKRKTHYCCYLLCEKAGLRISEAVNFNLDQKTEKGLYRIEKPKGKKERYVYIPKFVINELKKLHWKPQQTNRFNFYHFLRKVKRELGISKDVELSPHTLRRAFATYQAENGLPLPLLSKLLGHKSIRTTALYWINIYNEDGNDTDDILTGKTWLEKPCWKLKPESVAPVKESLEELLELLAPNLLVSESPPNYLSKIKHLEEKLSQIKSENNSLKNELVCEKEKNVNLRQDLKNSDEQSTNLQQEKNQIQQDLTTKDKIIKHLEQELASEQEKHFATKNNLFKEKKVNSNLHQQLQNEKETNVNLAQKLSSQEQNHTNLQNTYQITLKDKERAERQLNNLLATIKTVTKQFQQWQKLNYYKQLEQQNEFQAQIIQPPPWKNK